jgi:hypothetical protein
MEVVEKMEQEFGNLKWRTKTMRRTVGAHIS